MFSNKKNNYNKSLIFHLLHKLKNDDILALASQLAYSLILSFFPFLIFLMTLLGYSSVSSQDVLTSLRALIPLNAYELIYSTVIEILESRNGDLLSFSLVATIWTASTGFNAVIKGLNKAYSEKETRSLLVTQLIAILCTFALAIMIIFSFLLIILGNLIGNSLAYHFKLPYIFNFIWNLLRYFISVISMVWIFASLYKLTPSRTLKWREVAPGAIFAAIGWIIVSLGFAHYVDTFNNYSRLYGSIGAVIVLMIWIFLTSIIILVGGEINAVMKS